MAADGRSLRHWATISHSSTPFAKQEIRSSATFSRTSALFCALDTPERSPTRSFSITCALFHKNTRVGAGVQHPSRSSQEEDAAVESTGFRPNGGIPTPERRYRPAGRYFNNAIQRQIRDLAPNPMLGPISGGSAVSASLPPDSSPASRDPVPFPSAPPPPWPRHSPAYSPSRAPCS